MKIKHTKFKDINVHFWILFNIAICAILNDYIVYFTQINYGVSLLISTISLIITNFVLIKKKIVSIKSDFEWYDLVFILLLMTWMIFKIALPDYSYDTRNYHIYLQENIRVDKINFDFFAGKTINGFLFALGDRIHYIARYLLGYRLGTIFSYYSMVVIYYQAKKLLNYITGKRKLNSLFAILCLSSTILLQWTGSYYIDTFSVAFSLGIICYLFTEKNCFEDKYKLFFIAILTGILTGIKIINVVLISPFFIFFAIKRRKQLKLKNVLIYLSAILIFLTPFIIYIVDNLIQTGSPLYPYYNNILKSEYFGNYSWVEPLFGIPNWKYKLIWPIYTSLSVDGYGDKWFIMDPIWAIGYIVSISYIIYGTIKWRKKDKNIYCICIISIIMTVIWIEFLYGYMRYGLIIPLLYSITIACLLNKISYYIRKEIFADLPNKVLKRYIVLMSVVIVLIVMIVNYQSADRKYLLDNYKMLLKDRNGTVIHIDGVWGVTADDSALTQILREKDVPIYNLQSFLFESSEKAKNQYNDIIKDNKNIYLLVDKNYIKRKEYYMTNSGFQMEKVKEYSCEEIPYIEKDTVLYLYKIIK